LYLSKIYEALELLEGVQFVNVTRFHISPSTSPPPPSTGAGAIAEGGLIQLGENQIPVLNELVVNVTGGV
jgi:hypothetical protein